ncbi:hypothetical protein OSB04_018480 [Centaurea solstitialis]|uniref:Uncharacterized protein n=1 Tax=Centaurea solstitialis TaxID=347529 RepID=A0AA38WJD6_9ASTR|nr:hypothetical protein OSB04_018480 [Centaurea solstitialis]
METPPPVHSLSLTGVISETGRIIRNNRLHFTDLSFLFLPLAVDVAILSTPAQRLSGHHHKSPILHLLLYHLTSYILSLSAIAAITFSTYIAFQGKPVGNFSASVKTLTTSSFRILSTAIAIHLLQFGISLAFLTLVGSIVAVPRNLGLGFVIIDYYENSIELTSWFHTVIGGALLAILVYFQVNWSLAFPIAVAESKWGFAALKRSSYLMKGMRSVSFSLLLCFGGLGFVMVLFYTDIVLADGNSFDLFNWPTLLRSAFCTYCLITFMLMITAGNTVLYMYCKAFHGELALEGCFRRTLLLENTPISDL